MSTSVVGKVIEVGEFFWIDEDGFIGHDRDATHGNGGARDRGGSVDIGCTVTIRAISNGYAIVRLDRPYMPYGAEAPIGIVFQVPLAQIAAWPAALANVIRREEERLALAEAYCR